MNKTKTIYFLSAIVLIIGCYALNLSYSLFVQTESKDIVNATVPILEAELSLDNIEIEANKEYIIKQTIKNTGEVGIHYALSASKNDNELIVSEINNEDSAVSDEPLMPNSERNIYIYVKNSTETNINLNFNLDKTYSTVTNNLTSNINNENKYTLNFEGEVIGPYTSNPQRLSAHIINQYMSTSNYNSSYLVNVNSDKTIEDLFANDVVKISMPLNNEGKINREILSFTNSATSEEGLYSAEDDYGTSYYYRGASSVNYISFADILWRIVRINGDGSIRLIAHTQLGVKTQFNTSAQSPHLGYMFGDINGNNYNSAHSNINSSIAKESIDNIYSSYLLNKYEEYLADTLFCGDKSIYSGTGLVKSYTEYNARDRLFKTPATPTLKCAEEADDNYSRYTSKKEMATTTIKGVEINNDLEYPIALLSADEAVMAGAMYGKYNESYYLFLPMQEQNFWWTMTPSYSTTTGSGYIIIPTESITNPSLSEVNAYSSLYLRPVINLRSDVEVSEGNGTLISPYTIKLPE